MVITHGPLGYIFSTCVVYKRCCIGNAPHFMALYYKKLYNLYKVRVQNKLLLWRSSTYHSVYTRCLGSLNLSQTQSSKSTAVQNEPHNRKSTHTMALYYKCPRSLTLYRTSKSTAAQTELSKSVSLMWQSQIFSNSRGHIYQQCVEKDINSLIRMKLRMCLSTKKSIFIICV